VRPRTALEQIQVMTNVVLVAPMHPGEQVERFADVSENDHHQTPGVVSENSIC